MKTSVITSLTYQNHNTGPGHPERVDRVKVVNEELKKLDEKIKWFEPKLFDHTIIEKVHNKKYLEKISLKKNLKIYMIKKKALNLIKNYIKK